MGVAGNGRKLLKGKLLCTASTGDETYNQDEKIHQVCIGRSGQTLHLHPFMIAYWLSKYDSVIPGATAYVFSRDESNCQYFLTLWVEVQIYVYFNGRNILKYSVF